MRQYQIASAVTTLILVLGCSNQLHNPVSAPDNSQSETQIPSNEPIDLSDPTYNKTISKLFTRNCTGCHQKGGIAPFALTDYSTVRALGSAIKSSVVGRTMPPPSADNSGKCQTFSNSSWMKDEEVKAISSWIDSGMPEGDGVSTETPPRVAELPQPRLDLPMPAAYAPQPPAGELDDYRCFVLDPGQTEDTRITAIQVLPDQVTEVHHVIVFKPNTEAAQTEAEQKSGADGRPGYSCFGAAGVPSSVVGLWAPGGKSAEMHDSDTGELLGLNLEKGRKLIMQVHYNTQNGTTPDRSSIIVKTNPSAKRVKWVVMANFLLSLKSGLPEVVDADTQGNSWWQTVNEIFERGLADDYIHGGGILSALSWDLVKLILNQPDARDFKVYGIAPHMHVLGNHITVEKVGSQGNQCMADVPKFDFHWQAGYHYTRPLTFKKDEKWKITCHFNTMGRTTKTKFGEGTQDEMCLAFILVGE